MSNSGNNSTTDAEVSGASGSNARQTHVEPLLPFVEAVLTDMQSIFAVIKKAAASQKFTDLMETVNRLKGLNEVLQARASEYDAGLQALKDGHHALTQKCKDREQQLSDLELVYKSKREEETSLKSAIDQLKCDRDSITPKLLTSRATLDWVENKVKELRDLTQSLDQKRAHDDAELEAKRSTIHEEREDVDSKLASVAQKHQEHDARVAELEELRRSVDEAAGKNEIQLATFTSVMIKLRSALDLVGSPPSLESIQDDAQAIADVFQKTLESLKTQVGSQEETLALKDKSVETLSRQLKDAETAKRELDEAMDFLTAENSGLQGTIGSKDQELKVASTNISGLTDQVQSLEEQKIRTADALGAVKKDLDDKQKEVDVMARDKGRADDLDKRNQTLQSDLHAHEVELLRLKGVDLQARQLDEMVKGLEEELTSYKNQKSVEDWEAEVSALTEQTKSLSEAKDKADACYEGLQAFSNKQTADRMKLEQEIKSHKTKALESADQIKQLELELMAFKKQRPSADWEAEVSRLTEQITGLTDDKTNLTTRTQSLESEVQKRILEMGELDTHAKSLDKKINAYKTENQTLKDRARKAETADKVGKESVATLTVDKQKLEKELTVFRQQKPVNQWETEISALSSQVNTLNGEKQRWENLHTSDQGKITGLETQVNSLQTGLSTKTREFERSERKKGFLVDFLRRLHTDVFGQVGEQPGMDTIIQNVKDFIKTQQDLNTMVERFYRDAIPTGPAETAVAALPALHTDFSTQRNTVARLKTEHRQLKEQFSELGKREKQIDQDLRSEKEQQARRVTTWEHQVHSLNQSLEKEKADKASLQERLDNREYQLEAAKLSYKKLESQKMPGPDADEEAHMETLRRQLQTAEEDRAAKEAAQQEAQRLQRSLASLKRELTEAKQQMALQSSTSESLQGSVRLLNTELTEAREQTRDGQTANAQRVKSLEELLETAREDATERISGLEARFEEKDRQHRQAVSAAREPLLRQISTLQGQVFQLHSASGRPAQEPSDVPRMRTDERVSETAPLSRRRTPVRSQIPDSPPQRTNTGSLEDDDPFQGDFSDGEDYGPIRMNHKRKAFALDRRQGISPFGSIANESAGRSGLTGQLFTATGLAIQTDEAAGDGPNAGRRKRLRTGTAGGQAQLDANNTPASDGPVNEPPWKLDDVRQPGFQSSSVPATIVDEVQERIKEWDKRKPNWYCVKGEPKCANQYVVSRKSVIEEEGEACQECIRRHRVCVKLVNQTLEPLPLPKKKRGTASRDNVAFWRTARR
ncbi:MAG: hypothetical protein LQ346_003570 [Caloplaca aetnensis]|nr:MAG: hypothetical protein LQ346_003570 [Caloplaca aetnensis]